MLHMLKNSVHKMKGIELGPILRGSHREQTWTFRSDGTGLDTHVVELLPVPHILLPFFHSHWVLAGDMTFRNEVSISQPPLQPGWPHGQVLANGI